MKRRRTNAAIEAKNRANAQMQEAQKKQEKTFEKQTSDSADKVTKKD